MHAHSIQTVHFHPHSEAVALLELSVKVINITRGLQTILVFVLEFEAHETGGYCEDIFEQTWKLMRLP